MDFALHGGEDFELLFTVKSNNFKKISKRLLGKFSHIGEITENIGKIELIRDGKSEVLAPKGYKHF